MRTGEEGVRQLPVLPKSSPGSDFTQLNYSSTHHHAKYRHRMGEMGKNESIFRRFQPRSIPEQKYELADARGIFPSRAGGYR